MEIKQFANYEEMSNEATKIIAEQIKTIPHSILGLATGSSPIQTYNNLIKLYESGDLDFTNIITINLDEYRGLNKNHIQSYNYYMHKHLFNHVNIKEENIHLPNGENLDVDYECNHYEEIVEQYGIDLQLLGLGHNGHIGFNEPADSFPLKTHLVKLHESTIEANKRFFKSKDEVPKEAYTMGIGTIMKAKKIVMLASGQDKAEIVKKAFLGPITPLVPASILQLHPNFILLADEAALSLINKE